MTHEETVKLFKVGKVYLKGSYNSGAYFEVQIFSSSGNDYIRNNKAGNITNEMYVDCTVVFLFRIPKGTNVQKTTIKPIVYQNGNGEWEQYKDPQQLMLSTPNGLPGIPVDSGGNYTDEDGQQWVCDEIDLERGKYVQRVAKAVFDGGDDETWNESISLDKRYYINIMNASGYTKFLCNQFIVVTTDTSVVGEAYVDNSHNLCMNTSYETIEEFKIHMSEHPITVFYQRATPIETDLTTEQITALRQLRTFKPNTRIGTDEDVKPGMYVEYGVDTKMYIDNKIQEALESLAETQMQLLKEE